MVWDFFFPFFYGVPSGVEDKVTVLGERFDEFIVVFDHIGIFVTCDVIGSGEDFVFGFDLLVTSLYHFDFIQILI